MSDDEGYAPAAQMLICFIFPAISGVRSKNTDSDDRCHPKMRYLARSWCRGYQRGERFCCGVAGAVSFNSSDSKSLGWRIGSPQEGVFTLTDSTSSMDMLDNLSLAAYLKYISAVVLAKSSAVDAYSWIFLYSSFVRS
jgi:hypothetical protein